VSFPASGVVQSVKDFSNLPLVPSHRLSKKFSFLAVEVFVATVVCIHRRIAVFLYIEWHSIVDLLGQQLGSTTYTYI